MKDDVKKEVTSDPTADEKREAAEEIEKVEIPEAHGEDVPVPAENEWADEDIDPETARRKYLVRRFWFTARLYWGKAGDRLAWPLSAGGLTMILLILSAQYGVNYWNRVTFDALENRDAQKVLSYAILFLPLILFSACSNVANVYVKMTIQRRWRAWLTNLIIDRWLTHGRYYQLNLVGGDHDNPEYRIAQDLRTATDAPVDFTVGVLSAILSAVTFIVVLWTIGGALTLPLGERTIEIPGFLVIAAVVYSALASGLMTWIGRRFVHVSESVNQAEADYRYALTRVRENGESIALMGGEEEERSGLEGSLKGVLLQWRELCFQYMRTTSVSQTSQIIAPVIPLILCAPKYLEGSMTLGTVMQAVSAFTIVQTAFGWLVDNYPRLADWSAGARRIASLMVSLDALERAEAGTVGRITHNQGEADNVAMRLVDVTVTLDDGTAVIGEAEVAIAPGERVLLAGESGTGKSTLVRAIAGLWPWGGGIIEIKSGAKLFMLPQRPYVPIGTLRRAATYPSPAEEWSIDDISEVFRVCGLEHLVDRLEDEAPWDQTLSGGEKQRLAFVRMFLHQPDIVVFDEATSALDPTSQDHLMALVSEVLPGATVVSVGHRPELEAFHSRKIVLERGEGGAKFVRDVDLFNQFRSKKRRRPRWLRRRESRSKATKPPAA
ncbi:MAG: transporter ATP-binding protein [Rhodospirillales bacterium]|nr:transporter ATP-binding protein [Rhodospirillales bacterium]